jgi:hypothetical protein
MISRCSILTPHQRHMPKFNKHAKYSDRFDTAAYPRTIKRFSYEESLWALTLVYLEFSLPPQVALRAAEADLCQLDVRKCASCSKQPLSSI